MWRPLLYTILVALTRVHASRPAWSATAEIALPEVSPPDSTVRPSIIPKESKSQTTVCGYWKGNSAYPVSCSKDQYCGYNTRYGWWGCCGGVTLSSSEWYLTDCLIQTSCTAYSSVAQCDSSCLVIDASIEKRSNADPPKPQGSPVGNGWGGPLPNTATLKAPTSSLNSGGSATSSAVVTSTSFWETSPMTTAALSATLQSTPVTSASPTSPSTASAHSGSSAQRLSVHFDVIIEWTILALLVLGVGLVHNVVA